MINPLSKNQGQKKIFKSSSRFVVGVCGRRFGKTYTAKEKLTDSSNQKNHLYWYIGPTREQAKELMWDDLLERFDQLKWKIKTNISELSIVRLKTGTKIRLRSGEKYDRLRGRGLNGVIFDEFGDIKKEAWTEAVRPALSDKFGWAWFLGTPKGYNHFYDLYQSAKITHGWAAYQFKTIDSPFFQTDEGMAEIAAARVDLDERTFRQEYEASFESFSGRVIESFDRAIHNTVIGYDKNLPVIIGMDFNRSPMSAVVFQNVSGRLIAVREISLMTSNTQEMGNHIKETYGHNQIIIRPDASGSRLTSNSNRSDHMILRDFGFIVEARRINPPRIERWSSVNRAFERGNVLVNVLNCPKITKELETIGYKEGTCELDLGGDKLKGHLFDAFGYAVHWEFPIIERNKSRVLTWK